MNSLQIYRKRIIPEECILLKDDIILSRDNEHIVTKWQTLHPRKDFDHGTSCYYLQEGFKVSKFYRSDDSLLYWYCDIVDYSYLPDENTLIVTDLLADVIIYPDYHYKVMDLDELADASERGLITQELLQTALRRLNHLLTILEEDKHILT